MREIKLRAYHKRLHLMSEPQTLSPSTNWYFVLPEGSDETTGKVRDEDEVDFMQWTGLQDLHSKDIYDGDILREIPFEGETEPRHLLKVWWGDGCWMFGDGELTGSILKSKWFNSFVVVGNIYEHPSLLKHDISAIAKKLGQRGGKKTVELHGKKHFSEAGKRGMAKRWKKRRPTESPQ
jgi:hypothetical protein